jgi:hypothetical protein
MVDYGTTSRKQGWRLLARTAVLASILGVLAPSLPRIKGLALSRLDLLRAQSRWLSYTARPDEPAYENHYEDAQRLLRTGTDYVGTLEFPGIAFKCPQNWSRLMAPGSFPPAIVFLHERANPSGNRRLVAVDIAFSIPERTGGLRLAFHGVAYKPATLFTDIRPASPVGATLVLAFDEADNATISMGEPDPTDSCRFVIHGTLGDRQIAVVGQLERDDTITFVDNSRDGEP